MPVVMAQMFLFGRQATHSNYINSNNTAVNPQFVSATDFHLRSTSPCVNTGVYVGIPYSGTAPEKGYIEIGAPLPVTLVDFAVSENRGKKSIALEKSKQK